jgi:hypothetical protein
MRDIAGRATVLPRRKVGDYRPPSPSRSGKFAVRLDVAADAGSDRRLQSASHERLAWSAVSAPSLLAAAERGICNGVDAGSSIKWAMPQGLPTSWPARSTEYASPDLEKRARASTALQRKRQRHVSPWDHRADPLPQPAPVRHQAASPRYPCNLAHIEPGNWACGQ